MSARAVPSAAVSDEEEPVEKQSGEHRDELPEDLDVSAFVDAVLVNKGILAAGIALLLIGGYHLLAGYPLELDEHEALVAATREVGFPVGHASAQMGWRGLRSRPTWRILLYSADEPPAKRGLVLVDGVDGEVVSAFVEDNPEDWSEFD